MASSFLDRSSLASEGFMILPGFLDQQAIAAALRITHAVRRNARIPPDAQRLQPLTQYLVGEQLAELLRVMDFDRLRERFRTLVAPDAEIDMGLLGVLIAPRRRTYVLPWHRDIRDNAKGGDWASWYAQMNNLHFFNQFHVALYDDASFWTVPGSHIREDTLAERRLFPKRPILVDFIERDLNPWYDGADKFAPRGFVERIVQRLERLYYAELGGRPRGAMRLRNARVLEQSIAYCRSMPEAVNVQLRPGDVLVYRNSAWHTAIYRADAERTTVFSNISTPASYAWGRAHLARSKNLGAAAQWFEPASFRANPGTLPPSSLPITTE